MSTIIEERKTGNVMPVPLDSALSKRYLKYALATIGSRSLPDARDGLKPVHRRIPYGMYQMKLLANRSTKKSARIVGEVMGQYHPHGDQAIYDALVRMAQDFSQRWPLIFGQGNFGAIDGDNAAAMRYTEAKLTDIGERMLRQIHENAVDFQDNYDGENSEPCVLPADFPNLLANGAYGVAVGMAVSIPPHNILEICAALRLLLAQPQANTAEICSHIIAPDFPTGGTIWETKENIRNIYESGKGTFRLRANWHEEKQKAGRYCVIITSISYQVSKARLVEKIVTLLEEKKLPLLADIQDQSDENIRIVLWPQNKNISAEILMDSLWSATELETKVSINQTVLLENGQVPKLANLKQLLQSYLDHRRDVLLRVTDHRLQVAKKRVHILEGLLICFKNCDDIISIIREYDEPKPEIMKKYSLSNEQAEAILDLRLRSLRRLEEHGLTNEHDSLLKEIIEFEKILTSSKQQAKAIDMELQALIKEFSGAVGQRKTIIADPIKLQETSYVQQLPEEPQTLFVSAKGWVKIVNGHKTIDDYEEIFADGDAISGAIQIQSNDSLLVFSSYGKSYGLKASALPQGKSKATPVKLLLAFADGEKLLHINSYQPKHKYLLASSAGKGFTVNASDLISQTKNGKQIMKLAKSISMISATQILGDHVAVIGENRKLLIFPISQLPTLPKGQGVKLQSYKQGGCCDVINFYIENGLPYRYGAGMRNEKDLTAWLGNRAGAGRLPPKGFPKNNKFLS